MSATVQSILVSILQGERWFYHYAIGCPAASLARNHGVVASPPQPAGLWFTRKILHSV